MDISSVIAEATSVAEPAEATIEANENTDFQESASEEASEDIGKKPDSELTPEQLEKRESNRRSHENSRAAKLKRENRELREIVSRIQAQQTQSKQADDMPTPPNENNFSTWDDLRAAERKYYEDLADWKIEQKLNARDTKTQQASQAEVQQSQMLQRIDSIATKEIEFAKSNPEYAALYQEHSDDSGNLLLSPEVASALIESDDATLALFVLMKEGKLFDLDGMSPSRIAMEIGKAEARGEKYISRNKATNAPTPIRAAKGTGEATKSLSHQSVEELMRKFNKR